MFLPGQHGSPVAGQIAEFHNKLRAAVLEPGVLVFSAGALGVEPYPAEDAPLLELNRIVFAVRDHDVSEQEVAQWLESYAAEQAEAREQRDELAARASFNAQVREDERAARSGVGGSWNCRSCGSYKARPSDPCPSCGDDPVTYGGDRREFDRANGFDGNVEGPPTHTG